MPSSLAAWLAGVPPWARMTSRVQPGPLTGIWLSGQLRSRHHQLTTTLNSRYGHLGIIGLCEIGHGMDARVYHADSAQLGPVAIRVPHDRWVTSGNEARLDTRRQLRQDYELSRHLRAHGLPVPEVFVLHTDDEGTDFTIAQYIEADGSDLPGTELGRLIRAAGRRGAASRTA